MRTRFVKVILLLVVTVAAGLTVVRPTLADGPDQVRLGIAPLEYSGQYFDLTMAPGESRELKVEVANHGEKEIAARTYAADAYSIVGGGFGARLDGEPATGATLWLAYPALTTDLAPGMGLARPFIVTVPADAEPGEYITSLVIQNAQPIAADGGGGVNINQVQRQVIAVVITVPGARTPALTIGSFEHQYFDSKSVIAIGVSNTGNVRLKPSGELVVLNENRQEVSRFPVTMDTFYAGDTTTIEVPFAEALSPGDYLVSLSLDYEGGVATVSDEVLNVSRPTAAEADGAPSGAGQLAQVSQPAGTTTGFAFASLALIVGGGLVVLAAAGVVAWALRRRRTADRRPDPLAGWTTGRTADRHSSGFRASAQRNARPASGPPLPSPTEMAASGRDLRAPRASFVATESDSRRREQRAETGVELPTALPQAQQSGAGSMLGRFAGQRRASGTEDTAPRRNVPSR